MRGDSCLAAPYAPLLLSHALSSCILRSLLPVLLSLSCFPSLSSLLFCSPPLFVLLIPLPTPASPQHLHVPAESRV